MNRRENGANWRGETIAGLLQHLNVPLPLFRPGKHIPLRAQTHFLAEDGHP